MDIGLILVLVLVCIGGCIALLLAGGKAKEIGIVVCNRCNHQGPVKVKRSPVIGAATGGFVCANCGSEDWKKKK